MFQELENWIWRRTFVSIVCLLPVVVRATLLISFICGSATQWLTLSRLTYGSATLREMGSAIFNIFFLRWIRHLLYSITSQLSELTLAALWAALCLYHSLLLQNLLNVGLTSREICFWRVLADGSRGTILKLLDLNLSGPWRQPEVSLLRIFSDRETLQKSTLIQ